MGKLILVTGGARSGKSTFAEDKAKSFGENILYIATAVPCDDEMKLRIQKHKEQRPVEWETLEAYKNFGSLLENRLMGRSAVMLDCITVMVTNLMFEKNSDWDGMKSDQMMQMEEYIVSEAEKLIGVIARSEVPFILVTNEVGMGLVPEYKAGRLFRDASGRVNKLLAKAADEVFLCVSGIPVRIK